MLVKSLLDRFQMRVGGMLGREVLTLSTAGGGKDAAVDGGVVEGADATIVHTNLTEEHVIERTGLLLYFIYRNDNLQVVFLRYLVSHTQPP